MNKKMKPFDLEAALNGAPVVTRGGDPVTQLMRFDAPKTKNRLVGVTGGIMVIWPDSGRYCVTIGEHGLDLFMVPTKREGWVNIYRDVCGLYTTGRPVYKFEHEADEGDFVGKRIACVRIEWEE